MQKDRQQNQDKGYAAFISYRHTERDMPVAVSLHRSLETFKFPSRAIRKDAGKKKFGRVFRDKDELPLAGHLPRSLEIALSQSDWFICLLCDDYFESPYCVNELRCFTLTHGINKVIPVITAGEARDIFPKFWYALRGIVHPFDEKGLPIEPLAMVVTGDSNVKRLKNLKNEKLRLFARMLNVTYDTLYRRFHRRKVRVIVAVSALAIMIVSAFAVGAVYSAMQIEKQRVETVKNEIQLLIQRSHSDSEISSDFEAVVKALEAYERYTDVYPDGDSKTREQIFLALSAAAYSQPYQLVQNIYNDNRLIWDLCFSPDDRFILGISGGGTTLIDASNGSILSARAHSGEVHAVSFSPEGVYYLSAEFFTNRVEIFRTRDPSRVYRSVVLSTEQALVLRGAEFLSEASVLLSSTEGALIIWDIVNDTFSEISDNDTLRGTSFTFGAVISPDRKLAVCPLDFLGDTLPVIELSSGKRLIYPMPVELGGRVFAFSPDGGLLAGAFVSTVVIWDTKTREVVHVLETGVMDLSRLAFSPDGSLLAASSTENVMLFRTESGKLQYTFGELDMQFGFVQFGVAFSPDGKEIIIYGNSTQVYDLTDGKPISMFGGRLAVSAAYSNNGRYVALVTVEGEAGIFSTPVSATAQPSLSALSSLPLMPNLPALPPSVTHEDLYEYPQWFETSDQSDDSRQPQVFLIRTHYHDLSFFFMPEQMTTNPSSRFIATTYPDGCVEVWDMDKDDGRSSYLLNDHNGVIMQTRMTDRFLLTAGYDGRIMVFDLITGEIVRSFFGGERIPRFEVSKDGGMIIALVESCTYAQVYDLRSGKLIYTLEAYTGDNIMDIGFTEDGTAAVIIMESGKAILGVIFQNFDELLEYSRSVAAQFEY